MPRESVFRYFPLEEYEDRWAKTLAAMQAKGYAAAVVWGKSAGIYERSGDVLYLTNFFSTHSGQELDTALWSGRGFAAVVLQAGQPPELITDEVEPRWDVIAAGAFQGVDDPVVAAAEALKRRKLDGKIAFVGSDFLPLKHADQFFSIVPRSAVVMDDDLVRSVRLVKSERELDCFREGGEVVTAAHTALIEAMIMGKTEAEAAAAAGALILRAGGAWHRIGISHGRLGKYAESNPMVGFSTLPTEAGTLFHSTINGPIWQGYWLDPGRSAVCGRKPTGEQRSMLEALNGVMHAVMAEIRPGRNVREVALFADRLATESGYVSDVYKKLWPYYGHSNGCMWEPPYLEPRLLAGDEVFQANMVYSVEAFFEREGLGTAIYETNFIIGQERNEILTPVGECWW
jgi:Xaa-Pro aminopeptidase